jgi:GT2 family glycosyltransferase
MKVSVIIPTYNRPELLSRTLHCLWRQKAENYEIIICIDDDPGDFLTSTKNTISGYVELGLPIKAYETWKVKNKGWSVETYPYNVGIKKSSGEIILLNSADTLSVTNTIDQHREIQEQNQNVAAVSTVWATPQSVNFNAVPWRDSPRTIINNQCKLSTGNSFRRPLHFLMSVRKSWLEKIGGFDEEYTGNMNYGDNDLADRLVKAGCVFKWYDHVIAVHQWHPKPEQYAKNNPAYKNGKQRYTEKFDGYERNIGKDWGKFNECL